MQKTIEITDYFGENSINITMEFVLNTPSRRQIFGSLTGRVFKALNNFSSVEEGFRKSAKTTLKNGS